MLGVHRQSRQVGTEDAVLVQLTELAGVIPVQCWLVYCDTLAQCQLLEGTSDPGLGEPGQPGQPGEATGQDD